jgi:DNA polymerase
MTLHVDIETYSSVDIKSAGAYKYAASADFEILIVAFAVDKKPVECYDWDKLPQRFFDMLLDPSVIKIAHNAAFERICFARMDYGVPAEQWRCSAIKAAYCGLPMSLGEVTKALDLGAKGKLSTGSALIRYFCMPVKATLTNAGRTRNTAQNSPEKWADFVQYCKNDVEAEREIVERLAPFKMPESEWAAYVLDQQINDRGVLIDTTLARKAIEADGANMEALKNRLKEITKLENPNSPAQLLKWLQEQTGKEINSLAKDSIEGLINETSAGVVREVLQLRQATSKTSVKKYAAMEACVGSDNRARGVFQFYGAGRTGRWSGRLIQLQNLPRNYILDLAYARDLLRNYSADYFGLCYDISNTLSQLIRTALIPSKGKLFAVADFSAIEARVLAWLAGEQWRLDVFATHGKIYEASASKMFNVPLDEIGKGSDLRQKGKVAELALGYQGGASALETMGGAKMGLSMQDMEQIVERWRKANFKITQFWADLGKAAINCVKFRKEIKLSCGVTFRMIAGSLCVELPSGRSLTYWSAQIAANRFGRETVRYMGVNTLTKQWGWQDTYGGKLTENIVQAVSRDLLLHSMHALDEGYSIVMHVHDEVVAEVNAETAALDLEIMCNAMGCAPDWAHGLPLNADGYLCDFYKKD